MAARTPSAFAGGVFFMGMNGITDAEWMRNASCCVLLGGAAQAERDVQHVAWGSSTGGKGRPACCLGERCKWRVPSCALIGRSVQVEGDVLHAAWGSGADGGEVSGILKGGAFKPNVRIVAGSRARQARAASRRRCAPPPAAGTRRFPPQVQAACAPLQLSLIHI